MAFSVRQVHPLFFGEISGVDLAAGLDALVIDQIKAAMDTYAVVVFHDQRLDDDRMIELGHTFGGLSPPRNHRVVRRLKHDQLADISNLDENHQLRTRDDHRRLDGLGNQLWHSDASFRQVSGALSMLHAHVIPPKGGETEFADLRAAYDDLDEETKVLIENLEAEHSIFNSRGQLGYTAYTEAERAALPSAFHRVVRVHPGSKRRTLYLGAHAASIVGWPIPEGKLLLRDLQERATERRFVHRHTWAVGDLVIWDNRCTLHRGRPYDDATYVRDLRRVTTQDPEKMPAEAAE
jgi:alpha-ketoglutarate-dependent 2,4-dichlorophenoxyacetate dioxygenase